MTVEQLLQALDSAELTEWMAYFQIEAEGEGKQVDEVEAWQRAFNAYG